MIDTETIAACLSSTARGAIASIVVDGDSACDAVLQFFQPNNPAVCSSMQINVIYFGRWRWGDKEEEVVVCRHRSDRIEVHCHGGAMASRNILDSLTSVGVRELSWQAWLAREVPDRFVREARAMLPHAPTLRTTTILLDQMRGAMCRELNSVARSLSESDVAGAREQLLRILAHREVGLHLVSPWSVVLVGPPNVGKSSLINALLGFDRTIVDPRPGTTRDLVTSQTAFDGWPISLTDTAGMRESSDPVEAAGIRLATERMATADLIIWVHDAIGSEDNLSPLAIDHGVDQARSLHICSKADLGPPKSGAKVDVVTSTHTGEGIVELASAIARKLVPSPPPPAAAVPLSNETSTIVASILACIDSGDSGKALERIMALALFHSQKSESSRSVEGR